MRGLPAGRRGAAVIGGQASTGRRQAEIRGPDLGTLRAARRNVAGASAARTLARSVSAKARLKRRSKPIVRVGLPLRPRPQTEPAKAPGQDLEVVGQGCAAARRSEERARALLRARGELGAAHVAHHERVPGEDEPRLGTARPIGHHERHVLGRVARHMEHLGRPRCRAGERRHPPPRGTESGRRRRRAGRTRHLPPPPAHGRSRDGRRARACR